MAAPVVRLRRSATQGAVPTTAQIALGEIAINTFDGKLFLKKNNGTESIVELSSGGGGGGGVTDGDKGDITVSSSGATWTIDATVVSNSKLASVATSTFKGRTTAGTGAPEDLTATQATALLDTFTTSTKGLTPSSGGGTTNFLRADGTWNVPPVSISTNTVNQAQYLTYVTGTGNTTGLGVTTTGLVFNPSSNRLGIGTNNPLSKLHVVGDEKLTGYLYVNSSSQIQIEGSGGTYGDTAVEMIGGVPGISGNGAINYYIRSGISGWNQITFTGSNFSPVSSTLDLGTSSSRWNTGYFTNLNIAGDARITSTNKMRFGGTTGTSNFYIQYNSTTNSLDFVAG